MKRIISFVLCISLMSTTVFHQVEGAQFLGSTLTTLSSVVKETFNKHWGKLLIMGIAMGSAYRMYSNYQRSLQRSLLDSDDREQRERVDQEGQKQQEEISQLALGSHDRDVLAQESTDREERKRIDQERHTKEQSLVDSVMKSMDGNNPENITMLPTFLVDSLDTKEVSRDVKEGLDRLFKGYGNYDPRVAHDKNLAYLSERNEMFINLGFRLLGSEPGIYIHDDFPKYVFKDPQGRAVGIARIRYAEELAQALKYLGFGHIRPVKIWAYWMPGIPQYDIYSLLLVEEKIKRVPYDEKRRKIIEQYSSVPVPHDPIEMADMEFMRSRNDMKKLKEYAGYRDITPYNIIYNGEHEVIVDTEPHIIALYCNQKSLESYALSPEAHGKISNSLLDNSEYTNWQRNIHSRSARLGKVIFWKNRNYSSFMVVD